MQVHLTDTAQICHFRKAEPEPVSYNDLLRCLYCASGLDVAPFVESMHKTDLEEFFTHKF